MTEYHSLPSKHLSGTVHVFKSAPARHVTLQSPALYIMTDLRHNHVATIKPDVNIDLANMYMKQRGVRSLFVLNEDHTLYGIITATDILGEKPMRFKQERDMKHTDILVSDIMTPLNDLEAISINEVLRAKVGHIVASLRDAGRQHTLVMDQENDGSAIICGIFSLSQVEKQLGQAIPLTEVAKTFAEIEATVVSN